jgi:aryl-alcohol dehydrogenase-like predicted oxidoreductase
MRYDDDLGRARRLAPLVAEGYAASLAEAATRFVIANPAIGTVLVGMATPAEFEQALAAVEKGPLPAAALARLAELQRGFVGEAR